MQFVRPPGTFDTLHFAFLVDDDHFDRAMGSLDESRTDYWADPQRTIHTQIHVGGEARSVYLLDPFGHLVELLTRPYL